MKALIKSQLKPLPGHSITCCRILLATLLMVLSACGELPDPVTLQPGGCGLLVTLRFGPKLPESTGRWQGHLEVVGARISLLKSLELESDDLVPFPVQTDPTQLGWKLNADSDQDGLVARVLPDATQTDSDLGGNPENEIQVNVVDDINQKKLEYKFVQLKDGFQNRDPLDNQGWTHHLEIETHFVPGPCPTNF